MQIIIIIILAISLIGYIIYNKINQKKIQQKNLEEYLLQHRNEIDDTLEEYHDEKLREIVDDFGRVRADQENRLNETRRFHEQIIEQLEEKRKIAEEADARDIEQRQKAIEAKVQAYQEVEMQKTATAISDEKDKEILWAEQSLTNYWDCMAQETLEKRQEIEAIQRELEEWRKKRQAINEEIMRRKEVEDGKDFYRVVLAPEAVEDILLLMNLRHKLHNHDKLDELIYDVYYSKPVMEMTKRVLHGGEPSGIYKITRLKTGEIYIGKSTNIKKRWSEHCKTALGVGTIAHSILHTTMEKDGIDDFTFELLEEVPKEKLTEREKYWITFYDSKSYGLNERNG